MPTVPGFVHRPGAHCGSTALRDLAGSCAGVALSEAMCFGLGAGLGFAYLADPALSPSHGFCGRAPYLEPHFFSHLGIPFSWRDARLPWEELCQCVDANLPVLALADLYYLDYYASTVHFGGHAVVAAGYVPPPTAGTTRADAPRGALAGASGSTLGDASHGTLEDASGSAVGDASGSPSGGVLLADTAWPELQEVPYARFRRAMHSLAPPFPVDGQWAPVPRFTIPKGVLPTAVRTALATCASLYLHAPPPPELTRLGVRHYGISGLRTMAASLPSWADASDFAWCCRFAYQMIEKRGTGGSAFRRMYAAFLREARALVPAVPLTAIAEMERAAALWSEAAALFRDLAAAPDAERIQPHSAAEAHAPSARGADGPGPHSPGAPPAPSAVSATLRRIADILLEAASHEEEALTQVARL